MDKGAPYNSDDDAESVKLSLKEYRAKHPSKIREFKQLMKGDFLESPNRLNAEQHTMSEYMANRSNVSHS